MFPGDEKKRKGAALELIADFIQVTVNKVTVNKVTVKIR